MAYTICYGEYKIRRYTSPPNSVNFLKDEFEKIDRGIITSLLEKYLWMRISDKEEKYYQDSEKWITAFETKDYRQFLLKNTNSKELFVNTLLKSEHYYFGLQDGATQKQFRYINSTEKFWEYFCFYEVFFQSASEINSSVKIAHYY